jgi:hypothetical protein
MNQGARTAGLVVLVATLAVFSCNVTLRFDGPDAGSVCADDGTCTDADRPPCDRSLGPCVACVKDDQCPDAYPRCNRTVGQCVGCLSSSDCPDAELCEPASSTCEVR